MYTVKDIYSSINAAFPFNEAESWDNAGILVNSDEKVSKILVALDASCAVVNEAIKKGCQLIVTHHPVIFSPLKELNLSEPSVLALKSSVSIISAHTNFDVGYLSADAVLSQLLNESIGFRETGILDITQHSPQPHGFGRCGYLSSPLKCEELALALKSILNCDCLRFTPTERSINKIAFCCGGGSEYLIKTANEGYDAYITSDLKHNHFIDAQNLGLSVFSPTHYQMEKPAMKNLANLLSNHFPEAEIILSESEKEPSQVI